MVFPKLLAILLHYQNYFPKKYITFLRVDNVQEIKLHTFENYCTATRISLIYSVPYEHAHNDLVDAFIKIYNL